MPCDLVSFFQRYVHPGPEEVGEEAEEYLQVDFGHLVSLVGVATQGRFGNGKVSNNNNNS